jgi:FkbM family methyltransferase
VLFSAATLARVGIVHVGEDVAMISYAQNAEDVVLMRAFADVEGGFYVDVGAWDPIIESVTKAFYDIGWTGLNVEPQPERIASFDRVRTKDTNPCVAASEAVGVATLLVTQHSTLSTVDVSILDPSNPKYAVVDRIKTRTLPLVTILEEYARDRVIHFLKIDVEGHEAAVLRGADFHKHRPIILVIESTCPTTNAPKWPAWETLVLNAGYSFALFDGLNRFYVCNERADLLPKLCYGANCLDSYITDREAPLQSRRRAAEEELRRTRGELGLGQTRVSPAGATP